VRRLGGCRARLYAVLVCTRCSFEPCPRLNPVLACCCAVFIWCPKTRIEPILVETQIKFQIGMSSCVPKSPHIERCQYLREEGEVQTRICRASHQLHCHLYDNSRYDPALKNLVDSISKQREYGMGSIDAVCKGFVVLVKICAQAGGT
jgi:hypothetical protein